MGMIWGQPMGGCWEMLEWTLAGQWRSCFGWKILDVSQVGNLDGGLVRKFWLEPIWGIWKEFWLEIVKMHPTIPAGYPIWGPAKNF